MSSTKRKNDPDKLDVYYTPPFCVKRLLDELPLPGGVWLDAGAGSGALIEAAKEVRDDIIWVAAEKRPEEEATLQKLATQVIIGDFLELSLAKIEPILFPLARKYKFDVGIANPPFSLSMPFLLKMLELCEYVVLLQRLNFLGSKERAAYFRQHAPDMYVLPNRPIFQGSHGDSIEYAWFVYGPTKRTRTHGVYRLLELTPVAERRGTPYQATILSPPEETNGKANRKKKPSQQSTPQSGVVEESPTEAAATTPPEGPGDRSDQSGATPAGSE